MVMSNTILPAIRSKVGDWNFYSTVLSFKNIQELIKDPNEIHERQKLSEWIQREAIEKHSDEISSYIINNGQRFLGSLIIGVYDGAPEWSPLNVNFSHDHIGVTEEQQEELNGKLGFLSLSGNEKLFAIDGQHRVTGIRKALESIDDPELIAYDEIGAIFVSHDASTAEGRVRTRRLFTTVNKKAQRVSKSAIIALDEDNGFAILTRRLIDSHWLFEDSREHISYTSSGAIPADNPTLISSVVGLYEIVKDLYAGSKSSFEKERPTDMELNTHFDLCESFFNKLLDKSDAYKSVFVDRLETANIHRNNLLFRPIGQRVVAKVTQLLLSRGKTIEQALDTILSANLSLDTRDWHHILWNPIDHQMINKKVIIAETKLLNMIGETARTRTNQNKLDELILELAAEN